MADTEERHAVEGSPSNAGAQGAGASATLALDDDSAESTRLKALHAANASVGFVAESLAFHQSTGARRLPSLSDASFSITDLASRIPSWVVDLQAAEKHLAAREAALERYLNDISDKSTQYEDFKIKSTETFNEIQKQKHAETNRANAAEALVAQLQMSNAELQRSLSEASTVHAHAKNLQEAHDRQVKSLQAQVTELQAQNTMLLESLSARHQENSNLVKRHHEVLEAKQEELRRLKGGLLTHVRMLAANQPEFASALSEFEATLSGPLSGSPAAPRTSVPAATSVTSSTAAIPAPAVAPVPAPASVAPIVAPAAPPAPAPASSVHTPDGKAQKLSQSVAASIDSAQVSGRKRQREALEDASQPGVPYQAATLDASALDKAEEPSQAPASQVRRLAPVAEVEAIDVDAEVAAGAPEHPATPPGINGSRHSLNVSDDVVVADNEGTAGPEFDGDELHSVVGDTTQDAYLLRWPPAQIMADLETAATNSDAEQTLLLNMTADDVLADRMNHRRGLLPRSGDFVVPLGGLTGEWVNIGRDHPTKAASEGPLTGMKDPKVSRKQLAMRLTVNGAEIENQGINVVHIIKKAVIADMLDQPAGNRQYPRGDSVSKGAVGEIEDGDHLVFLTVPQREGAAPLADAYRPRLGHHFVFRKRD